MFMLLRPGSGDCDFVLCELYLISQIIIKKTADSRHIKLSAVFYTRSIKLKVNQKGKPEIFLLCFLICLLYGIMEWNTTLLLLGGSEMERFCIEEITLHNYRRFEEKTFKLNENMNLLIGSNASGKTSILESVNVALGAYLAAYKYYVPSGS